MTDIRLTARLLDWLATKASEYLVWHHERGIANARCTEPECPDCQMPESYCDCENRYVRERDLDGAYEAGYQRGLEAMREAEQGSLLEGAA